MKKPLAITGAILIGIAGCSEDAGTGTESKSEPGNPMTAPVDYLGAVGQAKKTAEDKLGTTSIDQAVQLFMGENGRNPKSLDELIQKGYMKAVPKAPYGKQFKYDPATGKVTTVDAPK